MKVIQVPEDVKAEIRIIQDGKMIVTEINWKFPEWLVYCIDSLNSRGKEASRRADKAVTKIESFNGAKELMLEDGHFELAKDGAENANWLTAANRRFRQFHEALEQAKDEDTATEKKK